MSFKKEIQILSFFNLIFLIICQTQNTITSDYKLCSCDLTRGSCDLNCCCDSECTAEIKQQFSSCITNTIITNDHVCSYSQISYNSTTKQASTTTVTSSNGFCIYKTNVGSDPYQYKTQSYDSTINLTAIIVSKQINYTSVVVGEPSKSLNQTTTSNSSQYPQNFVLSGNVGYELGKPVMKAIYNDSRLLLNTNPLLWWTVTGGDNCDSLSVQESIKFGVNMVSGCYITAPSTCALIKAKVNQYLYSDDVLATYRIASLAKVNLTNINDWLNITVKAATTATGDCSVTTTRNYQILFVKVGKTNYLHNKIIGVQTQSIQTNVVSNSVVYFTNVVNFIDVTGSALVATKLSPFLNIRLPYDFFSPILPSNN